MKLDILVVAKIHGIKTSSPYFVSWIPIFEIPTFSAFIKSNKLLINRDVLFDVATGPCGRSSSNYRSIIHGIYTVLIIDNELDNEIFSGSRLIKINNNIITTLMLLILYKNDHKILITPVLFASWLGSLITFLNLLPTWHLDGGHMVHSVLGKKHIEY